MRPNGLSANAIKMLAMHPGGVETATLAPGLGITSEAVSAILCKAAKKGLAWPIRSCGANNRSIWFLTEARLTAWLAGHPDVDPALAHKPPRVSSRQPAVRKPRAVAKRGVAAGVTIARVPRSMVEATNPNGVKVEIGDSIDYDPRYQVRPGTVPFGAGFTAVGIGHDLQTGKCWVAAAGIEPATKGV